MDGDVYAWLVGVCKEAITLYQYITADFTNITKYQPISQSKYKKSKNNN